MEKLRVGVIGVGHLGQHHARIYSEHKRCHLVGVVDINQKRAAEIAARCRTQSFFDHKVILGMVDAVSIAVPTVSHYAIARDFLEAGVHVLVEKPIANSVSEASALIQLAKEKNRVLQVGHIEHFNAAIQYAKSILSRPLFVETHRLGPYDPRVKDIGVVLDLMIHDIDIILQLVNSHIVEMDAVGVNILSSKEDVANVHLKFENGCTANVTVSRVYPKFMRKVRVFQDNAYISIDCKRQIVEVHRRQPAGRAGQGEPPYKIVTEKRKFRSKEPLKMEIDHFLECVQEGKKPYVTGEQARNALEVVVHITEMIYDRIRKSNLDTHIELPAPLAESAGAPAP
ncbi:MAG: Gfo/Idh/MocA family oxidoreductase [Candidatus Sumerlaeia bacterium]